MPATRKHLKDEFPTTFMPHVALAADIAAEEVLEEDRILRLMALELDQAPRALPAFFLGRGRAA